MATKTIVRWVPPNELYDRREITLRDLEGVGIFTQRQGPLVWDKATGFWCDAEGIAPEVMDRLESPEFSNAQLGKFTIETQEVEDPPASASAADDPKGPGQTTVASGTTGRKVKDSPQA